MKLLETTFTLPTFEVIRNIKYISIKLGEINYKGIVGTAKET